MISKFNKVLKNNWIKINNRIMHLYKMDMLLNLLFKLTIKKQVKINNLEIMFHYKNGIKLWKIVSQTTF